ncbi:MAG: tetratricopeptide repeat protein [Burkholderiales bacterium]|nr:tetratricopeptide repeat protein [Burkholderiales bacterium]
MTKRRKELRKSKARAAARSPAPAAARGEPPAASTPARRDRARWLALAALVAAAVALVAVWRITADTPAPPPSVGAPAPVAATYAGTAACVQCHAKEHAAWQGSQHDRAMQVASGKTVLGDFANAKFSHGGATATFFQRDGRFYVTTERPDGKPGDFEIKYTFGVDPLQQYLIELGGGRLQALGIAWDSRPRERGGQRWFQLYPVRKLKAGDPLHWTGIDQNWNYQCADCHSTDVRKGYDEQTGTFKTTWTDLDVGCEACHGPGSSHVAWAKQDSDRQRLDRAKGLVAALDERRDASWTIDPARGNAVRAKPRETNREIEACARCHSRRGQFSDAWHPGQPLGDAFRVSLIEPGLYYADGQQRDEVYTYGSFLQSRMHAQGVTCSDCHDPHTGKTRAAGNAVCAQCHAPAKYDAPSHTHHAPGSPGTQCVACHMPTTTYMVVDVRHDHGFRIPRPDRSVALGLPNACNQCHAEQSARWAADALANWFPQPNPGFQTFAEGLAAADRGAPGAQDALLRIARDRAQPAIARASALQRIGRHLSPTTAPVARNALDDPDPLVRGAAVNALAELGAAARAQLLARMLDEPVRVVRMDAARALAGEAEGRLAPEDRKRFDRALDEYIAAQHFNADRPEAQTALGDLHATRGRDADAAAAYRRALELDPTFAPAALNLADLARATGHEEEAERTLRDALKRTPQSAPVHHALGLALVRQKRAAEALAELAAAARLAPGDARFAYVYGVALHDTGKRTEAIRTLRAALEQHPYDREILFALATYERAAGDAVRARERVRLLRDLEPESRDVARLAGEFGLAR